MNQLFAKDHEVLKKDLKDFATIYKIIMLFILVFIAAALFVVIHNVIKYNYGDPLYIFGFVYSILFIFVGLYFGCLKGLKLIYKEYIEERKKLFQKYLNV